MSGHSAVPILVLGATGTTGGEVARQLIEAGHTPRLLVRDHARAASFAGSAEIVQGDLADSAARAAALQDIGALYLVTAGLDGPRLETQIIDTARDCGVRHIVKLSVMDADTAELTFARWHAGTETYLKASGIPWTMLRPGNFHTNALQVWAETIRSQDTFYQPSGHGKWASVDPADIGAVAVAALTGSGHRFKTYTLTGPESTNAAGYAAKLTSVLGRDITFVDVPESAAHQQMLGLGVPAAYAEAAVDLMAGMRRGVWDVVSPDVGAVLGRPATTFEEWVRQHPETFARS